MGGRDHGKCCSHDRGQAPVGANTWPQSLPVSITEVSFRGRVEYFLPDLNAPTVSKGTQSVKLQQNAPHLNYGCQLMGAS